MARGKTKPKRTPQQRLIDAAMVLAAEGGWQGASMARIAAAADMPLAEALAVFPSRGAVLAGLADAVDRAVLADLGADSDTGETPKDRLFDILMRRFDALAPYKAGLAGVAHAHCRDPLAVLCHIGRVQAAMALTLEFAGLPSHGVCGLVRTKGLMLIYANALAVWFRDDSPDMAATMAALDRGLARADRIVATFGHRPA